MTEPTTSNIGLTVPATGDLAGAWGTAALNPNFQIIDGMFGGVLSLSFSSATTITLGTNGASLTPTAGPNQVDNAALSISGTLSGNVKIQLPQPGVYRVYNNCTVGSNYVQLAPSSGTGNAVGVPDGEFRRFFYDGTNVYFLDMPHVGMLVNWCIATSPAWFNGCTVLPYLLCAGSTFTASVYPALNAKLGSTFGGDGVTTFGVPDFQSRPFLMTDINSVGRVTAGGSGVSGNVWGASGGNQLTQQHTHTNTFVDPDHNHSLQEFGISANSGPTLVAGPAGAGGAGVTGTASTGIQYTNVAYGSGSSQNMPPVLVGGLTYIKT